MEIVSTIKDMQAISRALWRERKTIAFVPTMGYLHRAHLRVFEEGRKRGDILVASVFVNPTQFGEGEDYSTYPRDIERDSRLARDACVDILFTPSVSEMYPEGYQTFVTVERVTENLCGACRPGHFRGVATVVLKLFNIVLPHIAVFGEMDFQQLVTIKRLVSDLNLQIEIVGVPTVREDDGLAMSSRNQYLTPEERRVAACLYKALKEGEKVYLRGERSSQEILRTVNNLLSKEPLINIEYIKVCDAENLEDIERVEGRTLLALAAYIGKARLIDSIVLE